VFLFENGGLEWLKMKKKGVSALLALLVGVLPGMCLWT
jgi:hypothetical protein